jgi:hypothetical protein
MSGENAQEGPLRVEVANIVEGHDFRQRGQEAIEFFHLQRLLFICSRRNSRVTAEPPSWFGSCQVSVAVGPRGQAACLGFWCHILVDPS